MTMREESAAYKAKIETMMGGNFRLITGDMERVRTAGTIDHALQVGDTVPEFTLPDAFGNQVSLKALLAKGPVVISFYRGEWCPFCNIALHALQEALPRMTALGATLVAISPEQPDHGIVLTEKDKLTFPVLSDFGNAVARKFGIVFEVGTELREFMHAAFKNDIRLRNGTDSYELPVPATYVVDRAGVIRFAHVEVDYMTGRADPAAILGALEALG